MTPHKWRKKNRTFFVFWGCLETEKAFGVGGGLGDDGIGSGGKDGGETLGYMLDETALVAFASMRYRRHIRSIGFEHKALEK